MILLIGLNLYKGSEPKISYTLGTLAQELNRQQIEYDIVDIDLFKTKERGELDYIINLLETKSLCDYKFFAISVFNWAEFIINPLIDYLKNQNPKAKIVLGGSQITYSTDYELKTFYPLADYYVKGYGEKVLPKIVKNEIKDRIVVANFFNLSDLQSPYSYAIEVESDVEMIRMETKRGCPYQCGFCAHFDKSFRHKVLDFDMNRVLFDLNFIKDKKIPVVNVLDPVFNMKPSHKNILKIIRQLGIDSLFKFQTRLELINEENLKLFKAINSHLEFGLQTVIKTEEKIINRPNNKKKVIEAFQLLNEYGISYEVSIIYGLPGQTADSFQRTIDFIKSHSEADIIMFPLGLLRGTPLYLMQDYYQIKTTKLSRFDPDVVISTFSFDYFEWEKMHLIAQNHKTTQLCKK